MSLKESAPTPALAVAHISNNTEQTSSKGQGNVRAPRSDKRKAELRAQLLPMFRAGYSSETIRELVGHSPDTIRKYKIAAFEDGTLSVDSTKTKTLMAEELPDVMWKILHCQGGDFVSFTAENDSLPMGIWQVYSKGELLATLAPEAQECVVTDAEPKADDNAATNGPVDNAGAIASHEAVPIGIAGDAGVKDGVHHLNEGAILDVEEATEPTGFRDAKLKGARGFSL